MGDLDVVELPAHMRPASRFLNASRFVNLLEPCVSIRLQRALELAQVCLRMFSLAIRRVGEPHRRWCLVSCWPIRRARRSTAVQFLFFHSRAPTLELACRLRAASVPPSRDVAVLPPTVRTAGLFRTPSPLVSSDPTPLLGERKSPIDGTAASDRQISTREYASIVRILLHLARLAAAAIL